MYTDYNKESWCDLIKVRLKKKSGLAIRNQKKHLKQDTQLHV